MVRLAPLHRCPLPLGQRFTPVKAMRPTRPGGPALATVSRGTRSSRCRDLAPANDGSRFHEAWAASSRRMEADMRRMLLSLFILVMSCQAAVAQTTDPDEIVVKPIRNLARYRSGFSTAAAT